MSDDNEPTEPDMPTLEEQNHNLAMVMKGLLSGEIEQVKGTFDGPKEDQHCMLGALDVLLTRQGAV